jgi:hypothetical protein
MPRRGSAVGTIELPQRRVRANPVVASTIREYRKLLDARASEEMVRKFLARHLYFWNGLLRVGNTLWTKISLGAEYEIDFVFCDPSSDGAEWHLVEIEPPSFKLFTAPGDPTKALTHSLRQVRDWQRWIERNRAYAQTLMPGIDNPQGHIFIGRRSELDTEERREQLHAINLQHRAHVEVHTLDRFETMARSMLSGSVFPERALTDKDLRAGVPDDVLHYIGSPMGRSKRFIRARQRRDGFDEDFGNQGGDIPEFITVTVPYAHRDRPQKGR